VQGIFIFSAIQNSSFNSTFLIVLIIFFSRQFVNVSGCFITAVILYMSIYGTIRSFSVEKIGWLKLIFLVFLVIVTLPIKIVLELFAILWAWVTPKNTFVVVDKNIWPTLLSEPIHA